MAVRTVIERYRKTSAPAWQRRLLLLVGALFGATLLLFAVWVVLLSANPAHPGDSPGGDGGGIEEPQGRRS